MWQKKQNKTNTVIQRKIKTTETFKTTKKVSQCKHMTDETVVDNPTSDTRRLVLLHVFNRK